MTIPVLPPTAPTMAPEEYTIAEFDHDIIDIIGRYPNNVNPRNDGDSNCVYERVTSSGVNHCLIGRWLFERGHGMPESQTADSYKVLLDHGYPVDVCARAQFLQQQADRYGTVWGSLLSVSLPEGEAHRNIL